MSQIFKTLHFSFLLLLIHIPAAISVAQTREQDSVKWHDHYLTGYNLYRLGKLDSAEFHFQEAENLSDKHGLIYQKLKAKYAMASSMIARSNYDSAGKIYDTAHRMIPTDHEKSDELIAFVYLGKGLIHYRQLQYDGAISNYKKAKALREKFFGVDHVETAKSYANIGMTYELIGDYDSSIYYQKKAIDTFKKILGPSHEYVGRMSHNIAISYHFAGESTKAIEFLDKAVRIRSQATGRNHPQVATTLEFMGSVFQDLGNYKAADSIYQESIAIRNSMGVNQNLRDIGAMYQNLSLNAAYRKDSLDAYKYAALAREAMRKSVGENDANYLIGILNEASINKTFGKYQTAIEQVDEFIQAYQSNNVNYISQYLLAFNTKGQLQLDLGQFQEAIESLLQGLSENQIGKDSLTAQSTFIAPIDALKSLNLIVSAYLKMNDYRKAEAYADIAKAVLINTKSEFSNQADILVVNRLWRETNELLCEIYFQQYQQDKDERIVEQFFNAMSQLNGSLIVARKKDTWAKKAFGIPDSVQLLERNVVTKINSLKKELAQADTEKEAQLVDQLIEAQFQLEALYNQIEKNYPRYHKLRNDITSIKLSTYQSRLDRKEASLHYAFAEDRFYILVVHPSGTQLISREPDGIKERILDGRRMLLSQSDSVYHISSLLYQDFVQPIESQISNFTDLVVFSDDVQNYFPMELTMDQNGQYLLKRFNISYGINPGLKYAQDNEMFDSNRLLSFAPDFSDQIDFTSDGLRENLKPIPGVLEEVESIRKIYDGNSFINNSATETNFKNNVNGYSIIHLATHAIVNDESPEYSKLAFNLGDSLNDGYLHAYEIYGMDIKAKMVALSACNTGFGTIQRGEGVMSLSHAFAYAGVPSTLVSLWPASDKSTPKLMKIFYTHLESGMKKDQALRQAKLDYLKNAQQKAAHPFYWGGFILTGDTTPVEYDFTNAYWGFGIGLVLLILMLGLLKVRLSA